MKIGIANDTIKFKKSSLIITMMKVLKEKPNKMSFSLCKFYILYKRVNLASWSAKQQINNIIYYFSS